MGPAKGLSSRSAFLSVMLGTPKRRGRPRKDATAQLSPSTLRMRKFRAKRALLKMTRGPGASTICDAPLPAALTPSAPTRKVGRPPSPSHLLTARSLETRRYRARKKCKLLLLALAAGVAGDLLPAEDLGNGELAEARLAEERVEAQRAESERRQRVRAARLLAQLVEHNPEGARGLLAEPQPTISHPVKTGACVMCTETCDSIVPCCGLASNPAWEPNWYCAACVAQCKLVYGRDPETCQEGRVYVCSPIGVRCPYCRKDGVFSQGPRVLYQVV